MVIILSLTCALPGGFEERSRRVSTGEKTREAGSRDWLSQLSHVLCGSIGSRVREPDGHVSCGSIGSRVREPDGHDSGGSIGSRVREPDGHALCGSIGSRVREPDSHVLCGSIGSRVRASCLAQLAQVIWRSVYSVVGADHVGGIWSFCFLWARKTCICTHMYIYIYIERGIASERQREREHLDH